MPVTRPGTVQRTDQAPLHAPRYHLVLLDDNDHTYAYVIELLGHVFGYGREKAFALACVVDSEGRAIVETADEDTVLRHQGQIHAYGADPRIPHCRGSMSAVIESALYRQSDVACLPRLPTADCLLPHGAVVGQVDALLARGDDQFLGGEVRLPDDGGGTIGTLAALGVEGCHPCIFQLRVHGAVGAGQRPVAVREDVHVQRQLLNEHARGSHA